MNITRLSFVAALSLAPASLLTAVPEPLRLWEISAVRYVVEDGGGTVAQRGLLDSFNHFQVRSTTPVDPAVSVPEVGMNRTLITTDAWVAYRSLSSEAVANFDLDPDSQGSFWLADRQYWAVAASPEARYDLGSLVNISARATVGPDGDPVIGGFMIEGQARRVLIRCVGPTLQNFGVAEPVPDPFLTVYKWGGNTAFLFNDDWGQRYDAEEIREVTSRVGAFPLAEGSKDAAYLVELPPGAYTVHLSALGGVGGTALLEVYVVP